MLSQILFSVFILGLLGFIFGAVLSYASKKFEVEVDPKVTQVEELLPGANCGGCGYPGCAALAQAIAAGTASPSLCTVVSPENLDKIKKLMGATTEGDSTQKTIKKAALIKCNGLDKDEFKKFVYMGVEDCQAAVLLQNGPWLCPHRCVGMGSCIAACPFGAMSMGDNHIPIVDEEKCVACGKCVIACPKQLIELVNKDSVVHVKCNSVEKGSETRTLCEVGCIGCKICEKNCAYDAIKVTDNLAKVDYEKCVACGACVEKCPRGSIIYEGKPNFKGRRAIINQDACVGCTICFKVCKFDAIKGGVPKEKHSVITDKCVGCGLCAEKCPVNCITMEEL